MEFLKKYQGQIIGILIAAIVIAVGFVLTDRPTNEPVSTTEEANKTNITVVDRPFGANISESLTAGTNVYNFKGVEWRFSEDGGRTQIRLQIIGLTKNGVTIEMLPYRLGSYLGQCGEMAIPTGLILPVTERPLAFAQCEELESSRQFVVTQEGNSIATRTRVLTQDTETPFEQIQTIDITNLPSAP